MKGFFNLFKRSAKELKNLRCLVVTAILIALDLILKMTVSIKLSESLTVSFAFIALSSIGMLYGPTVAGIAGIITDLLGFIIKPTGGFDIRYTFIEMVGAVIYGIFLYNASNDKWLLPRIVTAKSVVVIICNLWLTTWVTASYYGKGFLAVFPARVLKNLAQLPLDIILLSIFLPLILKSYNIVFQNARYIDDKLLFRDENVVKAMIAVFLVIFVIICSLGIAGQYLQGQNSELSTTVKEQQTQIDSLQEQLDSLYDKLGMEKPATE